MQSFHQHEDASLALWALFFMNSVMKLLRTDRKRLDTRTRALVLSLASYITFAMVFILTLSFDQKL